MSEPTQHYVPYLTPAFWAHTGLDPAAYQTFVETGSYRGATLDFIKDKYRKIYSIELSPKWAEHCRERFRDFSHIEVHRGDSAVVLPELMRRISEPAIVFLDAHYSGGTTAKADPACDTPLLEELTFLKSRDQEDILIIDDVGFLDRKGGEEPETPPDEQVLWPPFAYDWSGVTLEKVLAAGLKPGYRVLKNDDSRYTITPREDQLILCPARGSEQAPNPRRG